MKKLEDGNKQRKALSELNENLNEQIVTRDAMINGLGKQIVSLQSHSLGNGHQNKM